MSLHYKHVNIPVYTHVKRIVYSNVYMHVYKDINMHRADIIDGLTYLMLWHEGTHFSPDNQ